MLKCFREFRDRLRGVTAQLIRIEEKLDDTTRRLTRIELRLAAIGANVMATVQEIQDRVTQQTSVIKSVRVLVEQLQAASADPAALQAIVDGLDANNLALGVIANTGQPA